jgi:hypothetical protein
MRHALKLLAFAPFGVCRLAQLEGRIWMIPPGPAGNRPGCLKIDVLPVNNSRKKYIELNKEMSVK